MPTSITCPSAKSIYHLIAVGISAIILYCGPNYVMAAEEAAKAASAESVQDKMKSIESGDLPAKTKSKPITKADLAPPDKKEMSPDELAEKIAKKLGELRKENERTKAQQQSRHADGIPEYKSATRPSRVATSSQGAPHATSLAADNLLLSRPLRWSYDGEGSPQRWGKIDTANMKCDSGERQSPIDITEGIHVQLDPVQFDYKPTRFNVVDTGHTIQVNLGAGNTINILGRRYDLVQFHFHKPSEERINGRNYDMVAHLVHKDMDGKLVVIAVLMQQGHANSLVQTIWNNMPLEKNEIVQPAGTIDISQILPVNRPYFTYMGSLTTPPCTEGVLWIVYKEPVEVSQDQISIFNRMYSMNARPVQNSSGRLVKESD